MAALGEGRKGSHRAILGRCTPVSFNSHQGVCQYELAKRTLSLIILAIGEGVEVLPTGDKSPLLPRSIHHVSPGRCPEVGGTV
jgi:hypothetical protein